MKKEKQRCDTPDFMAELNGDSDETAADLANLERFISEDTSDGIINADTLKDLISEIHDLPPEFMEEFDFDTENKGSSSDFSSSTADGSRAVDSIVSRLKQEEVEAADREIQAAMLDIGKSMSMNAAANQSSSNTQSILTTSITTSSCSTATLSTTGSSSFNPITSFDSSKTPQQQQQQPALPQQQRTENRMPFGNSGPELSPAALTLKQMAEQHQHKAQMGMTPAAMTPSTGLSAPPTMSNQGAPLVPPPHHPPNNMRMRGNFPDQQQYNNQQQQPNQFNQMNRPPYTGQGGFGPNSPMIKKEMPYFANSPLGGNSPGPGRPQQQQGVNQVPGAKSSPVPMSQTSPMGPPTPQQQQQMQQQQQQFNTRKAPTPTNNNTGSGRTPPPSTTNVQFSQTQQQQMHMSNNNGQQIQVIPEFFSI